MLTSLATFLSASLVSIQGPSVAPAPAAQEREQPPAGLTSTEWSSLRATYEANRLAPVAVGGGHRARNPGQRWTTSFDGRGFTVRPDAGDWSWGLELVRYGFDGQERTPSGPACASVEGQRLEYEWDSALTEWYVNDARGLEHGYTLRERPEGEGLLGFTLALRGELVPSVQADGRGVSFATTEGGAALTYAGLKVFDADGRSLPAGIEFALDGLRLLVDERGARYPLTIDPIAQQAYLKASNTGGGNGFGHAVAITGNTVAIGAFNEESSATGIDGDQTDNSAGFSGAVYVFVRSGSTWSQQAYVKASNTQNLDNFGWSIALDGDTLVVGARGEDSAATGANGDQADNSAPESGAVYVFVRNGSTWSQQAYLKASNTGAGDRFGEAVAVSGDTLVVSTPYEDSSATGVNGDPSGDTATDAGAAYIFVRSGGIWSQRAYLKASNTDQGDFFGSSVALSDDTVVVGAPAEDSNATTVNGNPFSNSATDAGAAYVFQRSGNSWRQQAYLKASNTEDHDQFGHSVSISDHTLVVGAVGEDSSARGVNGNQSSNRSSASGAAYVFQRTGTSWSQQAYVKASNTGSTDFFGWAVSISGEALIVGAYGEASGDSGVNGDETSNSASRAGAAYVFVRSGSTWSQQAYLKASLNAIGGCSFGIGDYFGWSVALSGDTAVVGALLEDSQATGIDGDQSDESACNSGAAYVFAGICPPASATARNAGTNPASLTCTAPALGALWQGTVDLSTTGHSSAYLYAFAAQATIPLPGGQVVLGSAPRARFGPLPGPLASFSFAVPNDNALCGLRLTTQALHFGGVQPFATSNAMDLSIGP